MRIRSKEKMVRFLLQLKSQKKIVLVKTITHSKSYYDTNLEVSTNKNGA